MSFNMFDWTSSFYGPLADRRQQLLKIVKLFSVSQSYHQAPHETTVSRLHFAVIMDVNMLSCPTVWPGEEQPSLLDLEGSLTHQVSVSDPRLLFRGEELIHNSGMSPASTRPPRSKSRGDLVIVINEKMKNSKWPYWCSRAVGGWGHPCWVSSSCPLVLFVPRV